MTDTPPPPAAPAAGAPLSAAEDKQWASFAHLGGIIGFLPSLIIWLVFKDRGRLTDQEGKEALNFQLTALIGYVVSWILGALLLFIVIGVLFYLIATAIWILSLIWSILAFSKVNAGGTYRYPISIRFIK